jgi:hypothetical protein
MRAIAPELLGPIKEMELYQTKNLFKKTCLVDISNRAFMHKDLVEFYLKSNIANGNLKGASVIYLYRATLSRTQSIAKFQKSRGYLMSYCGKFQREKNLAKDFFRPEQIININGVNTFVIDFQSLTSNSLCQQFLCNHILNIDFDEVYLKLSANDSVVARNFLLASIGKVFSIGLRELGAKKTLQKLKDSALINRIFFDFTKKPPDEIFTKDFIKLCDENDKRLNSFLQENFKNVAPGVLKRVKY